MEELVELFVNNGTAIACLVYFMWYNNTTMKEFTKQINNMNLSLQELISTLKNE